MKPSQPEAKTAAAPPQRVPDWKHEYELHSKGCRIVAGVDEAGRGAWAGPLVAGAVVFPHPDNFAHDSYVNSEQPRLMADLERLRDSKMLSACVREELIDAVYANALAVGVGMVSPALIDVIGLGPANRLAWVRAVRDLGVWPDHLLLDAFRLPQMRISQRSIIKGDAVCMSIAAASIVAKVTRDRIMSDLNSTYPGYNFEQHKGYGTGQHMAALAQLGVTGIHRRSYAPIRALLGGTTAESISEAELSALEALG
jgi:ribonuclease HII